MMRCYNAIMGRYVDMNGEDMLELHIIFDLWNACWQQAYSMWHITSHIAFCDAKCVPAFGWAVNTVHVDTIIWNTFHLTAVLLRWMLFHMDNFASSSCRSIEHITIHIAYCDAECIHGAFGYSYLNHIPSHSCFAKMDTISHGLKYTLADYSFASSICRPMEHIIIQVS